MSSRSPAITPLDAIGDTPVVKLGRVIPEGTADVYVKLESLNPTGSYKDRMALAMIEGAEKRGDLTPGMTVVEYTGGSTGSSLAFVCAAKGYRFKVVSSDAFAVEKLRTMEAFGAEVLIEPSKHGYITPDLLPRMIERARDLAAGSDHFWTDQLNNVDMVAGYEGIGAELDAQLEGNIDAFCGGVGTAGMLMGVAAGLSRANRETRIVALEPAESPVITTGESGTYRVEGIGIGFVPPLFEAEAVTEVRTVAEAQAREMARRLAREEGIFAGISSGLNVVGAIEIGAELGPGHVVATVAVDTGLKYLAGDLYT